jgi:outer membrane protein
MKKLILLCSFAIVSWGWSAVKVGIVDMEKALQSVKKGKDAKARLEKKFNQKKAQFEKQKKEFDKAQEDFKKKSVVLSDKAKNEQMMELQQKFAELQQLNQQAQVEMQQEEVKETQPIVKGLTELMPTVGKEAKVDVVFEAKAGLLYAADSVDITDQLVKAYDKKK